MVVAVNTCKAYCTREERAVSKIPSEAAGLACVASGKFRCFGRSKVGERAKKERGGEGERLFPHVCGGPKLQMVREEMWGSSPCHITFSWSRYN